MRIPINDPQVEHEPDIGHGIVVWGSGINGSDRELAALRSCVNVAPRPATGAAAPRWWR